MRKAKEKPRGTVVLSSELRARCDSAVFDFETTADLKPLSALLGQERALDAIRLAACIPHQGFNIFVLGPEGSGRHSAVEQMM